MREVVPITDIESVITRVKSYNEAADVDLIRRAYDYAAEAHKEQVRLTGEAYISHPLAVAEVLADLEMDPTSIAAALLHDVIEDQEVEYDDLKAEFGQEIADLVDGVTKLALADFDVEVEDEEDRRDDQPKKKRVEFRRSAANLRKIFLAMARDLRVMVIKLADRLHNMRTLEGHTPEREIKIARETMQIYAPLAHRLGIWKVKWELEDLAFKYLEPAAYNEISEKVAKTRQEREDDLAEAMDMLKKHLAKEGISAHIQSRPKHLWSIYMKIKREEVDFSEIFDLSALRVIVDRVGDCYHTLGIVHDLWMPIPERFSDYIAKPKSNMYQSLHTKVLGPKGEPLEIQIRTWDMHRVSEFGVAAHWQYKERLQGGDEFERKLGWLRQQLFDWQTESKDAGEFLHNVINDLFTDQVFVFTPRGDVIDLPAGSSPIDFAYRIHSDVGSHCVGARVNGRIVPLTYQFNNGDIVEVITRSNSHPSLDWLSFVKTSQARNRIKTYFRKLHYGDSIQKGRDMLEKELERQGWDVAAIMKGDTIAALIKSMNYTCEDDLYAAIGYGSVAIGTIINKVRAETQPTHSALTQISGKATGAQDVSMELDGASRVMITRGKCCAPLPGEEVIGYISRGKGMVLHSISCPNVAAFQLQEPERLLQIKWTENHGERYHTDIKIKAHDRIGTLNDITAVFSEAKANIAAAKINSNPDKTADLEITVDLPDISTLTTLLNKVSSLPDVMHVERVFSHKSRKPMKK